jgi:hypothetical protein
MGSALMINLLEPFLKDNLGLLNKITVSEEDPEITEFLTRVFSRLIT